MNRVLSASWRYGLSAVFAVVVTIGLGLMMRSVIAVEFVPQPSDRIRESLAPYVAEIVCDCVGGRGEAHQYKIFALPPAPPSPYKKGNCIYRQFENPHDSRKIYVAPKPERPFPEINESPKLVSVDDGHCHGHVLRVPPKFPPRFLQGETSGFCKVSFVYDENGFASEIDIQSCTHDSLKSPTRKSVQSWRGCEKPSISNKRQSITIRYDLIDENGEVLPYP